jgi:SpoVK/Ycf46/Vps4 family AAA+-type ATPase
LPRHGRFDDIIPIGLPDDAARRAIWERYIPQSSTGQIDLAQLVELSDGFTPADIEFAARKGSQAALENEVYAQDSPRETHRAVVTAGAGSSGPRTRDYVLAIASTKSTVSPEVATQFLEDIDRIARV